MKKKSKQQPGLIHVPVRVMLPVRTPPGMTIRDLGRLAWMLGLEIDFNVRKIRKTAKKKG